MANNKKTKTDNKSKTNNKSKTDNKSKIENKSKVEINNEIDFDVEEDIVEEDIIEEDIVEEDIEENIDDIEEKIPELTAVQQPIKEKYEYNPVVVSEIVIMDPENRVTSEVLTRFEYTEILSIRSKQIENGGMCYTDVSNISDPIEMAKKELHDKKCPLDLMRGITDKIYEKWHVNEMGIPNEY